MTLRVMGGVALAGVAESLEQVSWDFTATEKHITVHSIHPYPAKFPPALPRTVIGLLSKPGDTVMDPFCGSGTSLVEALVQGRSAVGIDANPIAWLISSAKLVRLDEQDYMALTSLADQIWALGEAAGQALLPFEDMETEAAGSTIPHPDIAFWFDQSVVVQLNKLVKLIDKLPSGRSRLVAQCALSAIIVSVSWQDSDTRYVRRNKQLAPGIVYRRYSRSLAKCVRALREFQALVPPRAAGRVIRANTLEGPDVGPVDLVVTSPPYPNAWSYHLYHKLRMLWLGFDPEAFKAIEIGSHRKYSRTGNGGATPSTFLTEMRTIFAWLATVLRPSGYACFVVGDSIVSGQLIHNDDILREAATSVGFKVIFQTRRTINRMRKSFIPTVGKIQQEHVMVFQL